MNCQAIRYLKVIGYFLYSLKSSDKNFLVLITSILIGVQIRNKQQASPSSPKVVFAVADEHPDLQSIFCFMDPALFPPCRLVGSVINILWTESHYQRWLGSLNLLRQQLLQAVGWPPLWLCKRPALCSLWVLPLSWAETQLGQFSQLQFLRKLTEFFLWSWNGSISKCQILCDFQHIWGMPISSRVGSEFRSCLSLLVVWLHTNYLTTS